ncbi:MAG: hypothetical protein V1697_01955 [Candidatus Levyibacteriota bacterium]
MREIYKRGGRLKKFTPYELKKREEAFQNKSLRELAEAKVVIGGSASLGKTVLELNSDNGKNLETSTLTNEILVYENPNSYGFRKLVTAFHKALRDWLYELSPDSFTATAEDTELRKREEQKRKRNPEKYETVIFSSPNPSTS